MIDIGLTSYEQAKECKRGRKQSPVFETLKNWITTNFGFEVVCIEFDNNERPRLHIWFEKQKDTDRFYYDFENSKHIGYQIAEQYKILNESKPVDVHWLQRIKLYYTVIPKPEPLKNLYCFYNNLIYEICKIFYKSNIVKCRYTMKKGQKSDSRFWTILNVSSVYSCFSQEAIKEACGKVSSRDIDVLVEKYKKEKVWEIHIYDNHAYVFVYKHSDIEEVKSSVENELKEQWYRMLKSHDEFGYIDLNTIKIIFDSKENFDFNYQGQWHYYYK